MNNISQIINYPKILKEINNIIRIYIPCEIPPHSYLYNFYEYLPHFCKVCAKNMCHYCENIGEICNLCINGGFKEKCKHCQNYYSYWQCRYCKIFMKYCSEMCEFNPKKHKIEDCVF